MGCGPSATCAHHTRRREWHVSDSRTLTVHVGQSALVTRPVLQAAERRVSAIFRRVGVTVVCSTSFAPRPSASPTSNDHRAICIARVD